jgi:glycosyltransferase involved in cell wall biosynthesis
VLVKLCVLPNGICSPPHERGDRDIVLYLGRLVKDKGVAYLIEAMHQCPDQHLVVVGDGPERSRLENAARVTANVEFVGRIDRDRLSAYLRRAKILVLPSLRNEGMPNAIMEAMAHGVPVVAARGGGVRDLVKDGETGYLTDPGDAAGLAHYINQLGQNHILREKMSANCVEAMKQYAWPKVIGLLEQELTGLVAESRR